MAKRDEASPGTAFVAPLYLVDEDGEILATITSAGDLSFDASTIEYDPAASGLSATEVQGAVDELADILGGVDDLANDTGVSPDPDGDIDDVEDSGDADPAIVNANFATLVAKINEIIAALSS